MQLTNVWRHSSKVTLSLDQGPARPSKVCAVPGKRERTWNGPTGNDGAAPGLPGRCQGCGQLRTPIERIKESQSAQGVLTNFVMVQ